MTVLPVRPMGPTEHIIAETVDYYDDFDETNDECELEPHPFEHYALPLDEARTHACGYLGCGGSRLSPIHFV